MTRPTNHDRRPRIAVLLVAALAGFAVAAMTAIAVGKSFTLKVAKNAHVTNAQFKMFAARAVNKHEAIAVGPTGFAVYTFQGETTRHIICKKTGNMNTNCWGFWPPVSVKSAKNLSAQTGIKGKLGAFHNHGMLQLTLNNQPVYYFTPDLMGKNKSLAQGDELKTFGSTWHVVTASGKVAQAPTSPEPTVTTTTSTSTGYGY
jgi:hypothetical protein